MSASSPGKFKTKARFVALVGDELTLETEEGKTITMTLDKLSEADQPMARKIAAKAAPAASAAGDNPFAGKPMPPSRQRPRNQLDTADGPGMEPVGVEPAVDIATASFAERRQGVSRWARTPWSV